jgi:hypothetical protein
MITSLALVKSHLRVTSAAHDVLVTAYIEAVELLLAQEYSLPDGEAWVYELGEDNQAIYTLAVLMAVHNMYVRPSDDPITAGVRAVATRLRSLVSGASDGTESG